MAEQDRNAAMRKFRSDQVRSTFSSVRKMLDEAVAEDVDVVSLEWRLKRRAKSEDGEKRPRTWALGDATLDREIFDWMDERRLDVEAASPTQS